jgi:RimJ/RimL family protein N-acetyltransferase
VTPDADWPAVEAVQTARLTLEPLRVDHAEEMAALLDDPGLHAFIGGRPARLSELRSRYERQVEGRSADGTEGWFNWVASERLTGAAVGTVQATLRDQDGRRVAELAWVVAGPHQRKGYATEAAVAVAGWLRSHGIDFLVAHVHPSHEASIGVARHLGMTATDVLVDGEVRWTS